LVRLRADSSPSSPSPSNGCEIPHKLAGAIELGAQALTGEEACRIVRQGQQEIEARQGPPDFPEGPSLVIEGSVNQEWVTQCRTGSFPLGEGYTTAELYCNAILKSPTANCSPTTPAAHPNAPKPEHPSGPTAKPNSPLAD
jgi:hypothetical protein